MSPRFAPTRPRLLSVSNCAWAGCVGHCQKLKNNDRCFENAIALRALEHVGPPAAGRFQSLTEAAVVGARAVIRATSGKSKRKAPPRGGQGQVQGVSPPTAR
jgi:hypothetical protein